MDPDHAKAAADWLRATITGKRVSAHSDQPNHVCPQCIDRLDPPALARAVWFLLIAHVTTGSPVSLPPNVADVYLNDPDAYPANACEGCGYLLPSRSRILPDGSYRHVAWYMGECPVCGLDNHPDDQEGEDIR
jgi:hypothetical protein